MRWLLALLFILQPGIPGSVKTAFTVDCYAVADETVTVFFGYTSTGAEHFVGSGYDFVTVPGDFPQAFSITTDALPVPNLPPLVITRWQESDDPALAVFDGPVGEPITITFDFNVIQPCDAPDEPLPPITTPTATPCPFIAIDAATGLPYCYEPGADGVIPLPPELNQEA